MSLAGKIDMDFTDNTGAVVTCLVSDPEVCIALVNPSLGERAPAPVAQLVGPKGEWDYVDLFPTPPTPPPATVKGAVGTTPGSFPLGSTSSS